MHLFFGFILAWTALSLAATLCLAARADTLDPLVAEWYDVPVASVVRLRRGVFAACLAIQSILLLGVSLLFGRL